MSKKDYIAIAKAIKNQDMGSNTILKDGLIAELIILFGADNPNFKADKFREACG